MLSVFDPLHSGPVGEVVEWHQADRGVRLIENPAAKLDDAVLANEDAVMPIAAAPYPQLIARLERIPGRWTLQGPFV